MQLLDKTIGTWDGFLTNLECQNFVKYFDSMQELNITYDRQRSQAVESHRINDLSISCFDQHIWLHYPCNNLLRDFLPKFWQAFTEYTEVFSLLREYQQLTIRTVKIQKTSPGQGYHVWHTEQMTKMDLQRICTWTVYLNSVAAGGETEFLYQGIRLPAITGQLAIWPAGYTHAHRGNPPLTGVKYILTGWVEFE